VPYRGQRCEPAHVIEVQKALCALRGVSEEEGSALLAENFFRLFPTIARPA
jgi:Tat protein secretion system quality control protein TatD with DNase activity